MCVKRKISLICCSMISMFFFVSICYANHDIAYNEATIGGIGIDYSEDYLLQVYGQPTSIEKETGYPLAGRFPGSMDRKRFLSPAEADAPG